MQLSSEQTYKLQAFNGREGEYIETSRNNAARELKVPRSRFLHCYALSLEARDDGLAWAWPHPYLGRKSATYMSCMKVSKVNLDASSRKKVSTAPTSAHLAIGGMPRGEGSKSKENM